MRRNLPNRRGCTTIKYEYGNLKWFASFGRFPDGALAEVFLTSSKTGSLALAMAKDAAVAASLALQHGCPVETLRDGLARGVDGGPGSPLGKALDLIMGANS